MDEKQYKIDKMIDTLVELASNEVEKAKSRGYFSKDLAEATCYVIKAAGSGEDEMTGMGGYGATRYYSRRGRGEYGTGRAGYDTHEGYGNYEEDYEGTGNYSRGSGTGKGERYGRSGERYG